MRILLLLIAIIGTMSLSSADILEDLECHDKVVQDGIHTLTFPKEVEGLVGATNVDHFISNFGSKAHAPTWNSVAYFGGRYELSLQVNISVNFENCTVKGTTGSATVYLNEVTRIEISTSGGAGARLKGGIGGISKLNEHDWKKLIAHAGDWSVVNVPIVTNAPPIKDFDEYVRQGRAPIRNRKEGFDEPIKRAFEALRSGSYKTNVLSADCPNDLNCYDRVVCYGKAYDLPKEVQAFFGATNVDHFISKFGSKTQTPLWHSVAYFGGRYRLGLQFPMSVDYNKCKPSGAMNSAFMQIHEITKVDIRKPGNPRATMKGNGELDEGEWKWFLKNKGDWSVVKVPIVTNAPVRGFDEYVRQERARPLRVRQEDFDKPIRRAVDAFRYPTVGANGK